MLRGPNGASAGRASSFPSPASLDSLPRNPKTLLEDTYKKTARQGQSVEGQALVFIADLLRTGVVPGELRAALYKAAALIPGVTVTDEQAALDGYKGIAIGRVENASHIPQDIIIDPKTGMPIGERQVLTEPLGEVPAGRRSIGRKSGGYGWGRLLSWEFVGSLEVVLGYAGALG
ncbi:hypothetical protein [Arthrobacter sp. B2a2-09]|uniref:hypothetical protein n=1 Tax=Arthrobacter sp. B2a2-09 TaxID=2952822 RepID=UPI0022CD45F3|nr:hypothetical protein [Arthrobacter sp. B2a2-09]MCZ9880658.1 hypothetical protein [Arthrobacter sp. B2a2-09]